MKKLILFLLLFPAVAIASPFVVCDPQDGVTHYKLEGPSWVQQTVGAQSDGSLKMDVGQSEQGTTKLKVSACKLNDLWGEVCSAQTPFEYVRPAISSPAGMRLDK